MKETSALVTKANTAPFLPSDTGLAGRLLGSIGTRGEYQSVPGRLSSPERHLCPDGRVVLKVTWQAVFIPEGGESTSGLFPTHFSVFSKDIYSIKVSGADVLNGCRR